MIVVTPTIEFTADLCSLLLEGFISKFRNADSTLPMKSHRIRNVYQADGGLSFECHGDQDYDFNGWRDVRIVLHGEVLYWRSNSAFYYAACPRHLPAPQSIPRAAQEGLLGLTAGALPQAPLPPSLGHFSIGNWRVL